MNLLDLFFSHRCPLCRKVTFEKERGFPLCKCCFDLQKSEKFGKINNVGDYLVQNKALYCSYMYTGPLRDAIIKFKFNGEIWMAQPFADIMVNDIKDNGGFDDVDFITFVPVNDKRYCQRGYDQAKEIANLISKKSEIPLISCLKKDNSAKDNALEKKNRFNRVTEKRYSFITGNDIKDKNLLLIDDILTTGSTIAECTELLLKNGAATVSAAVLASGRRDL